MTLSSILSKVGKSILRTIAIVIGIIFAIFGYTIIKPIIRAIGWFVSIATLLLILFWLVT